MTTYSRTGPLALLSTLNHPLSAAFAQGTAFTYQGQLNANGGAANGLYDLRFEVWDALTSGNLVAGPLTNSATGVTNGLFTVTLDFGPGVFTGPARWLELDVRTNGTGAFTPLLPLQPLLPMPYALMANTASNLLGPLPAAQLSGTIPLAQLPGAVLTNNGSGVTLTGTFSGNGAGLTNLSGPQLPAGVLTNNQTGVTLTGTFNGNGAGLTNLNAGSFAPGVGIVPSGGLVLSATATNAAFASAGFTLAVSPLTASAVWSQATSNAPWGGRAGMGAVVFNGQMWVLGGYDGSSFFNDVWSSTNGTNWTLVTGAAPWSGRLGFGAVAFNGRMWVLGGQVNGGELEDVWSSSDGVNWTQATNAAPWYQRAGMGAVVFNGQIWVLGG